MLVVTDTRSLHTVVGVRSGIRVPRSSLFLDYPWSMFYKSVLLHMVALSTPDNFPITVSALIAMELSLRGHGAPCSAETPGRPHIQRCQKTRYDFQMSTQVSTVTCGLLGVAAVCESVFGEDKSKEKRQRNGVLGGLMAAAGRYLWVCACVCVVGGCAYVVCGVWVCCVCVLCEFVCGFVV